MSMLFNKKFWLAIIILVILGGLFLLKKGMLTSKLPAPAASTGNQNQNNKQDNSPQIISTKPDPLEEAVVGADQIVEITFNLPLQNVGEFKSRIEPKIDYKIGLSDDRKTARILPSKPYELGTTYTLFIEPDTKFDGVGEWGQEKIYHFKTIKYKGV